MAYLTYIQYDNLQKINNKNKIIYSPKKFLMNDNFKNLFVIFDDQLLILKMLSRWDSILNQLIFNKLYSNCEKEKKEITQLSLVEMEKIMIIVKYAKEKLNMKIEVALAFSLGIFYGTFIFEGTEVVLTLRQIYNIIPKNKRSKKGFAKFKNQFFIDGTNKDITNILYDK